SWFPCFIFYHERHEKHKNSYYNILIYDCRDFCKYCYLDASIVYPFKKDVTINFFCGKKIKKPRPTRRKDYAFSCAYLDARGIKHRLD
ncbi:MAG: hypothetical protein ACE5KT_05730, partial [Methanosarcinales archaeon]